MDENNTHTQEMATTVNTVEEVKIFDLIKCKIRKFGKSVRRNWKPFVLGAGAAAGAILLGGLGSKSDEAKNDSYADYIVSDIMQGTESNDDSIDTIDMADESIE